ncbi:MAG: hypothetical protein B7733_18375, partial [Myxococcales bacterium FL481]
MRSIVVGRLSALAMALCLQPAAAVRHASASSDRDAASPASRGSGRRARRPQWTASAELAIVVRDRGTNPRLHVLVLSSEPFAHRRIMVPPTVAGVAVQLRSWSDGLNAVSPSPATSESRPDPDGAVRPAPAPDDQDAATTSTLAGPQLERLRRDADQAHLSVLGFATATDQAVFRGPQCRPSCRVKVASRVAVLARGINEPAFDSIFSATQRHRSGPSTLFALTKHLREQWPSKLVVRSSAYVVLDGRGVRVESIFVDFDRTGRAEASLPLLHAWHLGESRVPQLIEDGLAALAAGDRQVATRLMSQATRDARLAIRTNSGVARWHGRLALALALGDAGNDEAVRVIRRALELAPNDVDLRLLAARVFELRGDS